MSAPKGNNYRAASVPPDDKKIARTTIMSSRQERRAWMRAAAGGPFSQWCRDGLNEHATRPGGSGNHTMKPYSEYTLTHSDTDDSYGEQPDGRVAEIREEFAAWAQETFPGLVLEGRGIGPYGCNGPDARTADEIERTAQSITDRLIAG